MFRNFIFTAVVLIISSAALFSQTADAGKTITKIVNASADDVWEILRELDNIDELSSAVGKVDWTGNKGVGGQRVCTTPDGKGFFKESIIDFDDNARTYTYALLEGVPVKGMINNFKVIDLGYRKSMIVWTSSYEAFMKNPQMTEEQFNGFIDQSANEMVNNVALAAQ